MNEKLLNKFDWTLFWKKQKAPILFHGTNSLLVENIMKNGLGPNKFYNIEAHDIVKRVGNILGHSVRYYEGAFDTIMNHFTFMQPQAYSYAMESPESAYFSIQPFEDVLKNPNLVTKNELEIVKKEYAWLKKLVTEGKPVVLYVETDLEKFEKKPQLFKDEEYLNDLVSNLKQSTKYLTEKFNSKSWHSILKEESNEENYLMLLMHRDISSLLSIRNKYSELNINGQIEMLFRGNGQEFNCMAGYDYVPTTNQIIPPKEILFVEKF